jgi:dimeric dUTPase (all-alpha-NTP-PPase superfamily)
METKLVQLEIVDMEMLSESELSSRVEDVIVQIEEFEDTYTHDSCIAISKLYLELGEYLNIMNKSENVLLN